MEKKQSDEQKQSDGKKVSGNSRARIAIGVAAGAAVAAGETLKALDEDTSGADDVAGKLFSLGGRAGQMLARGDVKGFNANLRLVRDAIGEYLEEEGAA
jgi:hypothetical protein